MTDNRLERIKRMCEGRDGGQWLDCYYSLDITINGYRVLFDKPADENDLGYLQLAELLLAATDDSAPEITLKCGPASSWYDIDRDEAMEFLQRAPREGTYRLVEVVK